MHIVERSLKSRAVRAPCCSGTAPPTRPRARSRGSADPRPLPPRLRVRADRSAVGRPANPGRHGLLPAQQRVPDDDGRGPSVLACYPSPAGATESELDLTHWSEGVGGGRLAALLEPDVEALLVRRGTGHDAASATRCVLVPVDACYRLVGLVRRHWRGFDGGSEAWTHIDAFFDAVESRAGRCPDDPSVPPHRPRARVPVRGDRRRPRRAALGPTLRLTLRITETTGTRIHALALAARSASSPPDAATPGPSRAAWSSSSATPSAGAGPSTRCSSRRRQRHPIVHRRARARPRGAADLRHRGRRDPLLPRSRRGRRGPAAPAVQRHRLLRVPRTRHRGPGRPRPVELGDHVPAPDRRVDADDGRPSRRHRLAAAPEDTLARLSAWRAARALPTWEQTFDALLDEAGRSSS